MSTPSVVKAIAVLKAGSIEGTVRFEQEVKGGPTKITASVKGVTGKKYTLHIHQFGDLTADSATGGFFNPLGSDASRKHADDIGELKSSASAGADASWSLSDSNRLVSLIGPTSIIGRSIVLHEDENDAKQGGKRVASAVIGIAA